MPQKGVQSIAEKTTATKATRWFGFENQRGTGWIVKGLLGSERVGIRLIRNPLSSIIFWND